MKYFSTFSGVGGFELGIPRDWECMGHSEIDKYASQVLRYSFPNVKNYGDITKIDWREVPDFDLLVGGSPCQSFSVAGKRAGFSGESGLFWEYHRCLQEKKPAYFLWENVKGALSSNEGRDFARILHVFSEAGYALWWQVLNAKDFGVPQNRERVFVFGTRTGSPREVFFEAGNAGKDISRTVRSGGRGSKDEKHRWDVIKLHELTPPGTSIGFRTYDPSGVAKALASQAGGTGAKTGLYAVRQPLRFLTRNQKKIEGDYAFTVDASNTAGVKVAERIRRLTPCECERLMGWPDDHTRYGINDKGETVEMSDTQRYKMCGNGVVSNVVAEVIKAHLL